MEITIKMELTTENLEKNKSSYYGRRRYSSD